MQITTTYYYSKPSDEKIRSKTFIFGYMSILNFSDSNDKNGPEIRSQMLQDACLRRYEHFKIFNANDKNDPQICFKLL